MKKTITSLLEELLTKIAPLSVALSIIGSLFLVFVLFVFIASSNYNNDENKYNNGVCTVCEGHYHLAAVSHGYYYYQCDKCESIIKVRHLIGEN